MQEILCHTNIKYFNEKEQKHIDTFFANEPVVECVYENAKGEQRRCERIFLPIGCVSQKPLHYTTYYAPREDGVKAYHTPLASEEGKEAKVIYTDLKTNEMLTCGSIEWLKWLGNEYKVLPKPPDSAGNPELLAALIAAQTRAYKNIKSEFSKDAQWQSYGQNKSQS